MNVLRLRILCLYDTTHKHKCQWFLLRIRLIYVLYKIGVQFMSVLYRSLERLCKQRGITAYRMCKDVGIQPSIMTDLKKGRRSSVKAETAQRIADYFHVSVAELLGNTDVTPPSTKYEAQIPDEEVKRMRK